MYIFLILEESKIIDKTLRVLLVNHSPPSPTAWDSVERHALCCLYQQLPLQSPHWGRGLLLGPWRPGGSPHWASCQGWRVSELVQPAECLPWHHCSQRVIHLFTHSVTDSPIHSFIHSSVIYWVLTWTRLTNSFIHSFISYLLGTYLDQGTGGWTCNQTKTNLGLPLEGSLPGQKSIPQTNRKSQQRHVLGRETSQV